MVRSYYIHLYFAICAFGFWGSLQSCIITFLNNGPRPVLLLDHNNTLYTSKTPSSLAIVSKGSSRRIGKSDEHAHFTVYTKHPKSNLYISTYEVKQKECGANGNPQITLSDLKNKTGEAALFDIIETNAHHSSMVRELPSLRKADIYKQESPSGCSACNGH